MSDLDRIDQRLAAVERAVVDGDVDLAGLDDLATLTERLDGLDDRLAEHERRIAQLEARVDAVGGFVGNVESVNDDVERQANAAIATVDRLEHRIDELERSIRTGADRHEERRLVRTGVADVPGDSRGSDRPEKAATGDRPRPKAARTDRTRADRNPATDGGSGHPIVDSDEETGDRTADGDESSGMLATVRDRLP